jgi:hypothetical protein
MIVKDFTGYMEGRDITKIPSTSLAYPSKNCLVHKGKVFTRLGIERYGAEGTTGLPVHSEKVWKDSKSGEMPLRMSGAVLQVDLEAYKTGAGWTDLLTLASAPTRMEFATFTDINTTIIKKRMFMVHGDGDMIQWNGGVAVVASIATNVITISGDLNLNQLGFDDGTTTTQTVLINGTEYEYSHDPTAKTLTLDSTPSPAPVAGDLVIVKPLTHTATLATIDKDHIYSYKNHIVIGDLNGNDLYFSHSTTYSMATGLDYTVPAPASRTAVSPMYFTLDANITAMRERKGVLWVSTVDDWFKITKLNEINGYDEWSTVEKVENAERMGALPFAVSGHKGDMIFIAQDSTVQSVSDLELLQSDQIKLISDDIEDTLLRYDLTGARIYYTGRYIYITVPIESVLLMLDVVEENWQPPQILPIQCMSIIGGVRIGHSNNTDESFALFSGKDDLGADIETVIAFGYQGYTNDTTELEYKWYETFGVSGRMTESTVCTVKIDYETDGAKSSTEIEIDGSKIKTYDISDDVSWGTYPFASRSWAGGDGVSTDLKRFFVFDKYDAISFFEWRPVFTITGQQQEFHLLAFSADVELSENNRENDLFIEK